MIIEIKKELKTIYLCEQHRQLINRLVDEHPDATFDLADCRIVEGIADDISRKCGQGVKFIDSLDIARNDILQQAYDQRRFDEVKTIRLPELKSWYDLQSFIAQLDKEQYYSIDSIDASPLYTLPLATLILLYRPAINLVPKGLVTELCGYMSRVLYKRGLDTLLRSDTRFVLCNAKTTFELNIYAQKVTDKIIIPGVGELTFEELATEFYVLPAWLGKEKIKGNQEREEFVKTLIEESLRDLRLFFDRKKDTIKSYLNLQ